MDNFKILITLDGNFLGKRSDIQPEKGYCKCEICGYYVLLSNITRLTSDRYIILYQNYAIPPYFRNKRICKKCFHQIFTNPLLDTLFIPEG